MHLRSWLLIPLLVSPLWAREAFAKCCCGGNLIPPTLCIQAEVVSVVSKLPVGCVLKLQKLHQYVPSPKSQYKDFTDQLMADQRSILVNADEELCPAPGAAPGNTITGVITPICRDGSESFWEGLKHSYFGYDFNYSFSKKFEGAKAVSARNTQRELSFGCEFPK